MVNAFEKKAANWGLWIILAAQAALLAWGFWGAR